MNKWDRNNFTYMQSLDSKQFDAWAAALSDDDVDYAVSLYRQARAELIEKTDQDSEEMLDVSQALSLLQQIAANAKHTPF